MINLSLIGMEQGKQYETIISTVNFNNIKNAAPIGVICSGNDKILCRIFKGGKTLDNILSQKKFIVNITNDPELYQLAAVGNLSDEYFNEDYSIKNIDAYAKCEVISFKQAIKQSDSIKKNGETVIIKSKVTDLIINNNVKALNRGIGYVIESLANFTRFDLVNDDEKKYYIQQFREAQRVVNKVGYANEIKAMNMIKKELIKKGFKP